MTLRIISGVRTDDIIATAIAYKYACCIGEECVLPVFADAMTDISNVLRAGYDAGYRQSVIGHSVPDDYMDMLANDSKALGRPVLWDNSRDSLRFKDLPWALTTAGESITAVMLAWVSYKNVMPKYAAEIYEVMDILKETANLRAFLTKKAIGRMLNALPYVYSPAQIFDCALDNPEAVLHMISSPYTEQYLSKQSARVLNALLAVQSIQTSYSGLVALLDNSIVREEDCDNICAHLFDKSEGHEYGAVIMFNWDMEYVNHIKSIYIRTRHGEAEDIARNIAQRANTRGCLIHRISQNRINMRVANMKRACSTRSAVLKKLLIPAVEDTDKDKRNLINRTGEAPGYRAATLLESAKAERIKQNKLQTAGED